MPRDLGVSFMGRAWQSTLTVPEWAPHRNTCERWLLRIPDARADLLGRQLRLRGDRVVRGQE